MYALCILIHIIYYIDGCYFECKYKYIDVSVLRLRRDAPPRCWCWTAPCAPPPPPTISTSGATAATPAAPSSGEPSRGWRRLTWSAGGFLHSIYTLSTHYLHTQYLTLSTHDMSTHYLNTWSAAQEPGTARSQRHPSPALPAGSRSVYKWEWRGSSCR